jgi:hypothetical protein
MIQVGKLSDISAARLRILTFRLMQRHNGVAKLYHLVLEFQIILALEATPSGFLLPAISYGVTLHGPPVRKELTQKGKQRASY